MPGTGKIDGPYRDGPTLGITDDEMVLTFGVHFLVFPKYPHPCSYVRIVDRHTLAEKAYWICDEWAEAPEEVMGAIIGAMCDGIKLMNARRHFCFSS